MKYIYFIDIFEHFTHYTNFSMVVVEKFEKGALFLRCWSRIDTPQACMKAKYSIS